VSGWLKGKKWVLGHPTEKMGTEYSI